MTKSSFFFLAFLLCYATPAVSQYKPEREHRIRPSQFPELGIQFIENSLKDVRKLKYYRETDSSGIRFGIRFRKDRLHYLACFDEEGNIIYLGFIIKKVDIPGEAFSNMKASLARQFSRFRIRSMEQQYVLTPGETLEQLIHDAFQNLLLPAIRYRVVVRGRINRHFRDFAAQFDYEGRLIEIHPALPVNYDHVLY